jgi:hypothetical protein
MGCRRPQVLELPYMLTGTPSNQNDRYVLANFPAGPDEIAAVEIDASSEIDCCIISHAGGFAYLAVGSPVLGPLTGPILVQPWRRVMPFSNDGQGYANVPLSVFPPKLSLKLHYEMPPIFVMQRAVCVRMAPDAASVGVAYAPIGEFPLYGRASARLSFYAGANALTYRIFGKQYTGKVSTGEQQDNPVGWNASSNPVQLTLDGSGSLELAVAALGTASVTFVGEPWDTLQVEAKSAAGSSATGITYQAAGEI